MHNGAHYFNPDSVDDIAEQLEKVLFSTLLKNNLILHASKRLSIFSWEKCANETLEIYKK
jgi:glycosyltransferase involved in cell wall biosynthesis